LHGIGGISPPTIGKKIYTIVFEGKPPATFPQELAGHIDLPKQSPPPRSLSIYPLFIISMMSGAEGIEPIAGIRTAPIYDLSEIKACNGPRNINTPVASKLN